MKALSEKMKNFYGYRSDSSHRDGGRNISGIGLKEMGEIVWNVLHKYLRLSTQSEVPKFHNIFVYIYILRCKGDDKYEKNF